MITNSDEDSTKVFQVYQDDPDTTPVENSQRNQARFRLRYRDSQSDTFDVFGDQITVLLKHCQLFIVESIDVSANAKGKRLNRCIHIAQDLMSLAGGGLINSFYSSGTSNGPADYHKLSVCHSNERNGETIDDIVNTADLNYVERYYSKLFPKTF